MSPIWQSGLNRASAARAILVLGAVGLLLFASQSVPVDHELRLRLPTSNQPACRLEIAWEGVEEPDRMGGGSIDIPNNRSRTVHYRFRASVGLYRLTVVVLRPTRDGLCDSELAAHPMREQRIRLEGGEADIDLHPAEIP